MIYFITLWVSWYKWKLWFMIIVTIFIRSQEKARKNSVSKGLPVFSQHILSGQKLKLSHEDKRINNEDFRIVGVTGKSRCNQPWSRKEKRNISAIHESQCQAKQGAHTWCPRRSGKVRQDAKEVVNIMFDAKHQWYIHESTEMWDMTWNLFKIQL